MTPPDSGEHDKYLPCAICGLAFTSQEAFDTHDSTLHHVSIPLPLAQRILAALEECGEIVGPGIIFPRHTALADELRAIVGRKP